MYYVFSCEKKFLGNVLTLQEARNSIRGTNNYFQFGREALAEINQNRNGKKPKRRTRK